MCYPSLLFVEYVIQNAEYRIYYLCEKLTDGRAERLLYFNELIFQRFKFFLLSFNCSHKLSGFLVCFFKTFGKLGYLLFLLVRKLLITVESVKTFIERAYSFIECGNLLTQLIVAVFKFGYLILSSASQFSMEIWIQILSLASIHRKRDRKLIVQPLLQKTKTL